MSPDTQEELREAVEEHLSAKRILGDLIQCDPRDPQYMAKVTVLEKEMAAHVMEEEGVLFKRAESILTAQDLENLGNAMASMARELRSKGSPRSAISEQTASPAPLPPVAPAEGAEKLVRP
jgi:hemerythrin superfamily protein